jgi:hypothetical protein
MALYLIDTLRSVDLHIGREVMVTATIVALGLIPMMRQRRLGCWINVEP